MALSRVVSEIFNVQNILDRKIHYRLRVVILLRNANFSFPTCIPPPAEGVTVGIVT